MTAPHSSSPALGTATKAAAVVLLATALVGSGAPAMAAGTHLCDGYRQCASRGMSASGYADANDRMYWQMYSGHNCTNYAAYRMVKSGMPNTRPWSGGGNAMYWGRYMSRITDNTPRVGAIAWWNDYSPGHVAYVERVISPTEIVISQDSWGGDFSWARVVKSDRWPDGFIHFNDRQLARRSAPAFSGVAKVGGTVKATAGSWDPAPTDVSYAWYVDGELLPRAKQSSVVLTPWMVGKQLRLKVTASRLGYPQTSVTTVAAEEILPGNLSASSQPRLSGTAQVDRALAITSGTWNPTPDSLSYQWKVDGDAVEGATKQRFELAPRHAGHTVTVAVTAKRRGYASVTKTVSAGEVALGQLSSRTASQVTGTRLRGETLRVTPGRTDLRSKQSIQWLRDGQPIPGATSATYKLVSADVARTISVSVSHARAGYRTLVERVGAAPVKGHVRLHTTRTRLRHGFVFTLRPTVAGRPVTEDMRVWVGNQGRRVAEGVVHDGQLKLRVTGLPRGHRTLWFHVDGTAVSVPTAIARRPYFR